MPCSISRSTAPSCVEVSLTPGEIVKSVIVAGSLILVDLCQGRSVLSGDTGEGTPVSGYAAKNYFCCRNLCNKELGAR